MRAVSHKYSALCVLVTALCAPVVNHGAGNQKPERSLHPAVPRTWDDQAMATLEVPLANPVGSPKHISADYYYRIPVRPIYKQYPIYAPGHEPPGYFEWLKKQEPVIVWDDRGHAPPLETEADWIKAGEIVFEAPKFAVGASAMRLNQPGPEDTGSRLADLGTDAKLEVRSPEWYRKLGPPISKDGIMPFWRYIVRKKGTVELGKFSCAMCHTRVISDSSIVKGAQGNFPVEAIGAYDTGTLLAGAKDPRQL